MTEDQQMTCPAPARLASGLWIWAAGLTVLIALLGLANLPDTTSRKASGPGLGVLGGVLLLLGFAAWTIWQYRKGLPPARLVLAGVTVYFGWTLIIGVTMVQSGRSEFPVLTRIAMLVELVRALSMIVATALSYTPSARAYFRFYERGRQAGAEVAARIWLVVMIAVLVQVSLGFTDSLPSHGRTWTEWATFRNAVEDATIAFAGLCLVPAWGSIVRQFRLGRQWARVALTVIGAVCAAFEVSVIVDASSFDTPAYVVCAVVQLLAFAAAVVASFASPVNAHFRAAAVG
ncbi:hypothetical protein [Amycolatopsis sp. NPDC059657]|uniref:hypothetical protein n=1 Tax=Amycolatopsis sp. NPDC059657 TaxID=3346899 RepID=UPI00366BD5DD